MLTKELRAIVFIITGFALVTVLMLALSTM